MRRFAIKIAAFCGLVVCAVFGTIGLRILWFDLRDPQRVNEINPGTRYLFIGSSGIGCGICESNLFANTVLWRAQLPPQFTLMRLLELERLNRLGGIEALVFEIGYQSIEQQSVVTLERTRIETAPLSMRYLDLLPMSEVSFPYDLAIGCQKSYNVREIARPNPGETLVQRSYEWVTNDLHRITAGYFETPRHKDRMCEGWRHSLENSMASIVALCRRHAMRPIVLICPMASMFRQAVPMDAEDRMRPFLRFLKDSGVEIIDGRAVMEDDNFMNVNHLHAEGAIRFTKWFYNKVRF